MPVGSWPGHANSPRPYARSGRGPFRSPDSEETMRPFLSEIRLGRVLRWALPTAVGLAATVAAVYIWRGPAIRALVSPSRSVSTPDRPVPGLKSDVHAGDEGSIRLDVVRQ